MSDGRRDGSGDHDDGRRSDGPGPPDAGEEATDESYRTVAGPGRAALTVRDSKFVARIEAARSVDAAESILDAARTNHPDATHVVPAYRVRADPLREYRDDDGEPGGSAGRPALNVLAKRDLENVVACVIRHYGGTNLGVGGLARAYGRAVGAAVDDAGVVVVGRPQATVGIAVEYDDSGTVRSVLESEGVDFAASYEARVAFRVTLPRDAVPVLRERVASATGGRAAWESDADPETYPR